MAIIQAGAEPLAELAEFLKPFAVLVGRRESKRALERYTTGLLSDVPRKTAAGVGRALPATNGQCLQEFLTRTDWRAEEMDRLRIAQMLRQAAVGEGVLVVDDTGFAKKGRHWGGRGASVFGHAGSGGQLPGAGHLPLRGSGLRLAGDGAAVSARKLGRRCGSAGRSPGPPGGSLPDQGRDCPGADR